MKTTCRKKYRIKSKFRFITSVVIMAGLMIGIIGAVSGLNVSRALTETKYKEVQICYGDTLWDIAQKYGMSVDDLMAKNDGSGLSRWTVLRMLSALPAGGGLPDYLLLPSG